MKVRSFPEYNYRAIWNNNQTLRLRIDPNKPITRLKYPELLDCSFGDKCVTGRCKFCFIEGSLITTEREEIPIEKIKKGDSVVTFDGVRFNKNLVEQLHKRYYSGELICIELENGKFIKCTPNHKIYTKNRGWVEAININERDELMELI